MQDRRHQPRARALKSAKIVFNSRFSTMDCTVRNLSPRGAKLIVGTQMGVPERFDLTFEADGSKRACRVIWRKEGEIGVEFA
jgi:PilZ domain